MNGDDRELWQEINRMRVDVTRQEERMTQVESKLEEIKALIVDLGQRIMTRDGCHEKHDALRAIVEKHIDRTDATKRMLFEKVIGWAVVAALAGIVGYAMKGAGI